jgi:hypothetical protein
LKGLLAVPNRTSKPITLTLEEAADRVAALLRQAEDAGGDANTLHQQAFEIATEALQAETLTGES